MSNDSDSTGDRQDGISRRGLLQIGLSGLALAMGKPLLSALKLVDDIDNPMDFYPNRDWEKMYRDVFRNDRHFHFLCAPNDTHNCLLRAFVKNDVITRIGPSYGYGKAKDLYGNQASSRWDPRLCQKGLALVNRIYGPRRIKHPMVRKGFRQWAEKGFPRDADGRPPAEFFQRGKDEWVKATFEEASRLVAQAVDSIARAYNGPEGSQRLARQGYDPDMIEAMHKVGTQVIKVRGGMPLLGITRFMGMFRFSNSLALLDAKIRGVDASKAVGGRVWDSYTWHTDLPPGHPMVTGQQTVEWDLVDAENAKLIIPWGMNWISTKMPDGHWLTEARMKGAKVLTVTVEYSSVANKSDEVVIIRPGSDGALALGVAHIILKEKLFDEQFVKTFTDLPLLVRMDTLKHLSPADIIPGYRQGELKNAVRVVQSGKDVPPIPQQDVQYLPKKMREEWGDFVIWDGKAKAPAPITRDQVGKHFEVLGIEPALEGTFKVRLLDGQEVEVRPVFDLVRQYVMDSFSPEQVSKLTWAPKKAIESLARQIAANPGKTLIGVGLGPNHFFNNDCKDRAILLVCSLTRNIGFHGGNVGSYAGNYRAPFLGGVTQFINEDVFDLELDPARQSRMRKYYKAESAHYYNYGDRPLRVGNKNFTGKGHMPTPTKFMWFCNANSILGNAKWHHDVVVNTLPKIECVVANDWWWTASCEYADVVFAIDSWAEMPYPDMTASVTNPFLQIFPKTRIPRLHDTRGDMDVYQLVSAEMAKITGDGRFNDCWKFVKDDRVEAYIQRILDASNAARGYEVRKLIADAENGIPALLMTRTYPKMIGWEQSRESKPWYTKSGRLEFYRAEPEFIEYGENLPVYREPVDGTHHEPNVIVGAAHPAFRFAGPEQYGLKADDLSTEARQVRNVLRSPEEVVRSRHPLAIDGYKHIYITPKYRHSVHSMPSDIDIIASWFGPFGDMHRRDRRMPWVGEGYVDMNPLDARELGLDDGDYVYADSDPSDRPYRGWKKDAPEYKVARCMLRVRYYWGIPRGVSRSWFHMFVATYGSVEGHETNADGLARNPRTGYQAMYRYGSHQSCTRAWLRPTCMTDSLVRKELYGQEIGQGFLPEVHCAVGAPKEAVAKYTRAEAGSPDGKLWRPAQLGLRPTYETKAMKTFLEGNFIRIE
ncbi:MAG: molybdopterin-dependent oxidoreductase [Planctomycetes bacterium]|nr:molybdopterin-dependent oxidoreductase [Planctomycetota bacterium]